MLRKLLMLPKRERHFSKMKHWPFYTTVVNSVIIGVALGPGNLDNVVNIFLFE